ncbi:MAG: NADH-quinone oxidoreductase subunit J [Dehalococcoidia bacterium]|nr:NADH-quinone oxidoreductase subunit J [Dehalococcoidia bacterium]
MGVDIAFWIFAIVGVIAAIGVVALRNLFRAALMLVLCFFTVAGIYASLSADFLAVAQVLVYMGAISVLIIFAVMLTKQLRSGNPFSRAWPLALVTCACLMGLLIFGFVDTTWPSINASQVDAVNRVAENQPTTGPISDALFNENVGFLLPFELAATLILAAVLGAIALMRDK